MEHLERIFSFEICFQIIFGTQYHLALRDAFARLLVTLWVDREPY